MKLFGINAIAATAVLSLLVTTGHTFGQDTTTNANRRAERREPSVAKRVERLSEELTLTSEQKAKVTAVFEKQAKQRQEIVADKDLSRDDRREKMRALMQGERKELKEILTSEQFEKMQQLRQAMRSRRQGGPGQAGEAAPAPEPKTPDNKAP